MASRETTIRFDKGTLILEEVPALLTESALEVKWDERTRTWRAPAHRYREIVLLLRARGLPYADRARAFSPTDFPLRGGLRPRDYQEAAMRAWLSGGRRGVIVLPTGAGKTIVALLLIEKTRRPTLIHVPTIDLMHQWYAVLSEHFGGEIGLLGGGYKELAPLTVATYDSALLHVPSKGNRFGFLVFDECHHLPGPQYQFAALGSIAPFRLGLTATPERADGRDRLLDDLVGPVCYRARIRDLEGSTLAPYRVITREVELSEAEAQAYAENRAVYLEFLRQERIDMRDPGGWRKFLWRSSRSEAGRRAFEAYLVQKRLSQAAQAKETEIWRILTAHRGERILIFTQQNDLAYQIGRRFFLPVLTHHTKVKEREAFLEGFRNGTYPVLVTSKVLNEGVDVPEANVAVIVSGSGSVREHVQRLGRVLRARPGKEAFLYELVTQNTGEFFVNQRRRRHDAYQGKGEGQGEARC